MSQNNYWVYKTTQEAWQAMLNTIAQAKKSIYWELYILSADDIGKKFIDLLLKKACQGVEIKLILDYFGSFWLSKKIVNKLEKAGIEVIFFNYGQRNWWSKLKFLFNYRNHRKVLIIDEKIGFIGGVNIRHDMKDWYDIHLKLQGKLVRSLLRNFIKSYLICGGKRKNIKHLLKLLKYRQRIKGLKQEIIYDSHQKKRQIKKYYQQALLKARERIIIFSPYYFPDKDIIKSLWLARQRGVKVDLLLPLRADIRIATYVNYALLTIMSKLGINVHLTKKMMHGKGVIVDDNLALIGSTNLDHQSLYKNYEANIQVKETKIVKKIKRVLDRWIKNSKHLDKNVWQKRSKKQKILEKVSLFMYKIWFRIKK